MQGKMPYTAVASMVTTCILAKPFRHFQILGSHCSSFREYKYKAVGLPFFGTDGKQVVCKHFAARQPSRNGTQGPSMESPTNKPDSIRGRIGHLALDLGEWA
jgi:hypothetical protein